MALYESMRFQPWDEWVILYNGGAKPLGLEDARIHESVLPETEDANSKNVGFLKGQAVDRCTGDILVEVDHDDMLLPGCIEKLRLAFEEHPDIGFVYSNSVCCNQDFEPCTRYDARYGWTYRDFDYKGHPLDETISMAPTAASVSKIWGAPNHVRAFRRTLYDKIGGYDPTLPVTDDLDLMCRMFLETEFLHLNEPLYLYRVHGENTWLDPDVNKFIQTNTYALSDKYLPQMAEAWTRRQGLRCVELGGRMAASKGFETVDLQDADIVADLNERWPFEDNSIGVVRAFDIFEHLNDPIHTMRELYRVLAPGAYAFIQVPSTDGRGAFQDPTHVSFWNENSFLYYTHKYWNKYISPGCDVRFQPVRLFTTDKDIHQVCWVRATLMKVTNETPRVQGELDI